MKKFLFIVPLTPAQYCTPLRSELVRISLDALKKQTYPHWKALLIGSEEKTEGNLIYKKTAALPKEIKLIFARECIDLMTEKPDYVIRLDDDDIISPTILEKVISLKKEFDCYADQYHTYYDVVSGKICQTKNNWLPNTVIHKTEHALSLYSPDKTPLVQLDHSEWWKNYYSNKKIIWANKKHPVYIRLLSPTAISSDMHKNKILEFSTPILNSYFEKIRYVGKWNETIPFEFKDYVASLRDSWKKVSGRDLYVHPSSQIHFFTLLRKWIQKFFFKTLQ